MINDIGTKIRHHRKTHKLTLTELGQKTGINNGNLSRIERGEQSLTNTTMKALADAFGLSLSEMLQDIDNSSYSPTKDRIINHCGNNAAGAKTSPNISSFSQLIDIPIGTFVVLNGLAKIKTDVDSVESRWGADLKVNVPFASDAIRTLNSEPGNLYAIVVTDDTMTPRLFPTDRVIVDTGDQEIPTSGGIFAVCTENGPIELRRLFSKMAGSIIVSCDNNKYPSATLEANERKFLTIIGRVKASQSIVGF